MYKYFCVSNLSTDMEDVLFARLQMAVSLGFHIIFACIGMTMPFLMATAEYKYNKTGQPVYLELAKAWSKGVAIFFAVGAVSGTVLSFELGLLFPTFMEHAGPIFGMPFSWEGTAFFLEAIALGLFLYGWKRLNKWMHWFVGIVVGISGVASGIFVVAANAWMNSPTGFDWDPITQQASNIEPWAAMFNDAWFSQALHMTLAAFTATGFAVAGIHAILLLKDKTNVFHQKAFKIAAVWGGIFAIMMPISGDFSAKDVAKRQPVKLAAMEAHFHTEAPADLIIGGIPNEQTGTVDFAIRIPRALSFLAYGNFDAEVKGLNDFPRENWPPVAITHYAFQTMVGIGSLLMIISLIYFYFLWRKRDKIYNNKFLKLFAIATPLGFIAVEAGWTVTEVGRQPWIIYGIMRTADSVTPMPGLVVPFILFTVLYLFLSVVVIWLLKRQIKAVEIKFKNNPEGITT